MRCLRVGVFVIVSISIAAGAAGAAQEQPPTLGSVASLRNKVGPDSDAALTRALGHAKADVRIVAGRVAAAARRKTVLPAVRERLVVETDDAAAAEQIRALLSIQGADALPVAKAAAARVAKRALLVYADWLARKAPITLASELPELAKIAGPDDAGLLAIVAAMATRQHPATTADVSRAWVAVADGPRWRVFLNGWLPDPKQLSPYEIGVTAPRADIREATIWHALSELSHGRVLKLPPGFDTPVEGDTEWTQGGRHLLARHRHGAKTVDLASVIERGASSHRGDAAVLGALTKLTSNERKAVEKALGNDALEQKASERISSDPVWARSTPAGQTFTSLTPGFLASALEMTGCPTGPNVRQLISTLVRYADDGIVDAIGVNESVMSKECAAATAMLASLEVAVPGQTVVAGATPWLIMPLDAEIVACIDRTPPRIFGETPDDDTTPAVTRPEKTKHVNPHYPESAQRARVQGVVIVDAHITESGCIAGGRIVRSIVPALDVEALAAILQWRFTPAMMNGKPVPAEMTVTVNFTLH